jgi:hypothetical protein
MAVYWVDGDTVRRDAKVSDQRLNIRTVSGNG